MTTDHPTPGAVEIPPRETNVNREFLRLPPVGERCPVTGLSRAALNAWILPTKANGRKPPVKSFVIRQPGAKRGIRLISYRVADLQNVAQVSLEAGNSPQMIFKHYRELVRPEDAKAWFAIEPKEKK